MNKFQKKFGSFYKFLPKGCLHCKKGSKMVLFITGICHQSCFYCPISQERKNKDLTYANEKLILNDKDILFVVREMDASGTGITGGEPLLKLKKLIYYIKLLKNNFGEKHHIHLYTSIPVSKSVLSIFSKIKLDEIRIHPLYNYWKLKRNNYMLRLYSNSIINA